MNIGVALTCMECGGGNTSGVCDADDLGTPIDCLEGVCSKAECSENGETVTIRKCGSPFKMESSIDTKTSDSECQDGV